MNRPWEEPTTRREVLALDPDLALPAPPPLAAPIFEEPPLVQSSLAAPVLSEEFEVEPVIELEPWGIVAPGTALGILGAIAVIVAAVFGGVLWVAAVITLLLLTGVGLTVLAYQPVLVICAMGFFLGAAPGVQTPVLGVSITFVLSAASWIALAVMPEVKHRVNWAAGLSAILVALAFFSFAGNPVTAASASDFVRWSITVAAVYPLSVLPAASLARVGRWFVYGCTAAAAFGIVFVTVDRDGTRLNSLTVFGYNPAGGNGRFVFGESGNIARLTSTYVDPNLGGFLMAVGLILGLALLRGRIRVICSGLLILAIALTLSRADIGSVAVAGVLLVLFSRLPGQLRGRLFAIGTVAGAAMLAVPAIRSRLTNSFGANDRGSSARWEAFEIFPDQMAGHWLFGRGFGSPELTDATAAAATNYVANAPLLTVYRGGIVVGIAFTLLMLAAALAAWRLLRSRSFESAAVGAGYLGLMLIALQLDFPVVTLSPATLAFGLLLAFLTRPEVYTEPESAEASHG